MKICFVIGSMSYSGAEKVLSALVETMAEQGHEIHIILLEKCPGKQDYQKNITIYGAYSKGGRVIRVLNRFLLIRNNIKDISPDIVVSFGYVCNINCIAALLFYRIPLVLCERNDPRYDPISNFGKKKRELLYPFATGYVFQTANIQSFFSKAIQQKSIVIPNPVIKITDEIGDVTEIKKRKSIINIARLDDYQKNQTMLIKSFSAIANRILEYDLYIYGNGPDKERYESLIEELNMENRIFLCGKINNVISVLKNSDIFVLTSNFEGMPNALIEAMSSGLPCISTDCGGGGAEALIKSMENGILVSKGNNKELEDAILLLANNIELRKKLGREAKRINEVLNIADITNIWIEFFYKIKG